MVSRSSTRLLATLVVTVALGSGCVASKETRDGADELRDALGTPSWASSVDVETGLDGRFADRVQITVDLESAEAGPDDLTDFVEALPPLAAKAGLDSPNLYGLTFVSPVGSTLDLDWSTAIDPDKVASRIQEWFTNAVGLGPTMAATLRTDGHMSYLVTLGDDDAEAVGSAYQFLVVMTAPDTSAEVTATADGVALALSASPPLTHAQVATWTDLLRAISGTPADLPASAVSLQFLDRTVADVLLGAPDDTTEDTFTTAAYGDRVWSLVQPQLRAMAALPDAWSYFASWAPASTPTSEHLFISLLSDQEPIDNGDEPSRWSAAAQQYVQGL